MIIHLKGNKLRSFKYMYNHVPVYIEFYKELHICTLRNINNCLVWQIRVNKSVCDLTCVCG